MTQKELLRLHMDAMFTLEKGRMACVNEPWGSAAPAPLLYAGRTLEGELLYRFGQRADAAFIKTAETLLRDGVWDGGAYMERLGANHCEQAACFCGPRAAQRHEGARLLGPGDAQLLRDSFAACAQELESAYPYAAAVTQGRIVSICRSVRNGRAREAGIETLPAYRRKGYAYAARACWTEAMQREGLIPLYSARIDNTASLSLAQKAGYTLYAHTMEIDIRAEK